LNFQSAEVANDSTTAENILVDVLLAVLPSTILWKLNMTFKNRIILCILLGLGLWYAF
jgi:hypothetical protein